MGNRIELYQTPVPSTDFSAEPILYGNEIRFGYVMDGLERFSGLRFNRSWAKRTRSEVACTAWHIEDVYDTLVEIENSSWISELQYETRGMQHRRGERWIMHHYMIYLDSVGCFEFLSESWEVITYVTKL